MTHKVRKEWTTNRDIAKRPARKAVWCFSCDRDLVSDGCKCGTCGKVHYSITKKRLKKDAGVEG